MNELLKKYDVAVPRYTSYPTVPFWSDTIDPTRWENLFADRFDEINSVDGISLYIHLPFCESLCTYCGCNKKITTNHSVEDKYLETILQEWQLYRKKMHEAPLIRELHLGGGTPTFFSPANLQKLINGILKTALVHPLNDFSFEGHPNNTTRQHLDTLYKLGFRRVSYGVQDHNAHVQTLINRIQPYENVERAVKEARAAGYTSVNFDLIYGLPGQTIESIEKTIQQSIDLKPDRIAFYSYAHVPWKSRMQRLFDEHDLPGTELKMQLYLTGKRLFVQNGYADIGMDHFALQHDELYTAWKKGQLHRNFMGYTTKKTGMLLGLGVSSISDAGTAYAQNHKTLQDYYTAIEQKQLAVTKGYFLNKEDIHFRKYILNVSCNAVTVFDHEDLPTLRKYTFPELAKLEKDNLVHWSEHGMEVTAAGRQFIRNICSAFDLHLLRSNKEDAGKQFSKAV